MNNFSLNKNLNFLNLVWREIQENLRIEVHLLKKFDLDKTSYREAIKKFSNDS